MGHRTIHIYSNRQNFEGVDRTDAAPDLMSYVIVVLESMLLTLLGLAPKCSKKKKDAYRFPHVMFMII